MGVLGGYLYWKVVLQFWFGHPKCHFRYPQNGKNSQNSKTTFQYKLAPKTPKKTPQEPISDLEKLFLDILHFFDIFTSFSLEHGPFFSTWWPSEEDAGKVIFLQKWPLPMLVQSVSGGRGILGAFCFFWCTRQYIPIQNWGKHYLVGPSTITLSGQPQDKNNQNNQISSSVVQCPPQCRR